MFFDEIRTLRTINNAPNDFTIKIFLYLAINQPNDGISGYKIEKSQLQFDLKLGKSTFFNSLHWLRENLVVNELKLISESDFMVNPYIVMNNGDRDPELRNGLAALGSMTPKSRKIANANAVNSLNSKINKKKSPRLVVRAFLLFFYQSYFISFPNFSSEPRWLHSR